MHALDRMVFTTPDDMPDAARLTRNAHSLGAPSHVSVTIARGSEFADVPAAWHQPASGDIVLNGEKIKDFSSAAAQGALLHEIGHARFTTFSFMPWFADMDAAICADYLMSLEELRIERALLSGERDYYSRNRRTLLRASALTYVVDDLENIHLKLADTPNMKSIVSLLMLAIGRREIGVFNRFEIRDLSNVIEDVVGTERFDEARVIMREFAYIDRPSDRMVKLATELHDLFKDDIHEEMPWILQALLDAIKGEHGLIAEVSEDLANEREDGHVGDPIDPDTIVSIFHGKGAASPSSRVKRAPSSLERQMAVKFGRMLEKLSFHERSVVKRSSVTPPGRLRSRAAVQGAAQAARGAIMTAEPWERRVRRHTDTPEIRIGIAFDISGSMSWAERFVAATAYVIANGCDHVNGKSAAVAFGDTVKPIYHAGEQAEHVIQYQANGGSEAANEAIAALTKELRLFDPGARMLFVISDGHLVNPGEMPATAAWVKNLTAAGVKVFWIDGATTRTSRDYRGFPAIPVGAIHVPVDRWSKDFSSQVQAIVSTVAAALR